MTYMPTIEKMEKFLIEENILRKEPEKVISVLLKDTDDDVGFIGDHYIVKIDKGNNKFQTLLVNRLAYEMWDSINPKIIVVS